MEPVRTCIGCRKTDSKTSLVRLAITNGRVVIDASAAVPGRGAWLHPEQLCWERAVARGAMARAFRSPGVDTSSLGEEPEKLFRDAVG